MQEHSPPCPWYAPNTVVLFLPRTWRFMALIFVSVGGLIKDGVQAGQSLSA